jgi:ribosomal protein S18 acetylase RimI-like enzyme
MIRTEAAAFDDRFLTVASTTTTHRRESVPYSACLLQALGTTSLGWATDVDVLPGDRVVTRRDGYWVVRSPRNPSHFWGNFLVFDDPPHNGDRQRWEAVFALELGRYPGIEHGTFVWDRIDGAEGQLATEFPAELGYEQWHNVALLAAPGEVRAHPRADRSLTVRALDPRSDEELWDGVLAIWIATNDQGDQLPADSYRTWAENRLAELRDAFAAGDRGSWWVALDGGTVAASLGVVVTGPRARYQAVDTVAAYRRRGIASRLVVAAADSIAERYPGVERFVIVADRDYHALGLYESLGFRAVERLTGAFRTPSPAGPSASFS